MHEFKRRRRRVLGSGCARYVETEGDRKSCIRMMALLEGGVGGGFLILTEGGCTCDYPLWRRT